MGESVEGGEEGMGLNLGLSIGGCFMGSSEEKDGVLRSAAAGEAGLLQQQRPSFRGMYCRNKEEAEEFLEQRRKKEMHALRRQAARRKRDEKRGLLAKAKKARSGEEGEDEQAGAADGKGKEEGEEEERRQQQGMYPGGGFPVVPMMQYVIQNGDKVQYIPVTVPCVLPCWPASSPPPITGVGPVANGFCGADPVAIAARSGAGTLFQPVPCRSLPSEGGAPGGVNKLSGTQSSSGSSSSAVSDNKSGGGSTTDSVSQSQSSHNPLSEHCRPGSVSPVGRPEAVDMAEGNATVQWKPPAVPAAATVQPWKPTARAKAGTNNEGAVANGGETDRAQAEKAGTPAMPPSAGGGGGGGGGGAGEKVQKPSLNLPQMPCVSTTGNGPNGKTITGFLYRYTKSEVSIMCVCHGSSFSPAEFIKHAGGTDTDNPLRHIIVVPSPVG